MPVAPCRYLILVPWALPATPLVVRRSYLIVVPRQLPAAPLLVCLRYLSVVPRLLPAAPRRCRNVLQRCAAKLSARYVAAGDKAVTLYTCRVFFLQLRQRRGVAGLGELK
jgi:hypothetical protein